MKDNAEKILNTAQEAHLTAEEKSSGRVALSRFMDTTPTLTPYWTFFHTLRYHYVPALLVLFILLGTGSSYYAQHSNSTDTISPTLFLGQDASFDAASQSTTEISGDTLSPQLKAAVNSRELPPSSENSKKKESVPDESGVSGNATLFVQVSTTTDEASQSTTTVITITATTTATTTASSSRSSIKINYDTGEIEW